MTAGALLVVPGERHVERLGRAGYRAVTRERLRVHLFEVVERERVLAAPIATRLVLTDVLARVAPRDPLLASSAREGGDAWGKTFDAIDDAIGALRRAGTSEESLARVARNERGAVAARAGLLYEVMHGLDVALDARGLIDPRAIGSRLARAIAAAPSARVRDAIGGRSAVARFIHDWDGEDATWWRALDDALRKEGGSAKVELPAFEDEIRIDASRVSSPLDVVSEDVARALDAPPATFAIAPALGDLRLDGAPPESLAATVTLCAASDAEGQARAVVHAVHEALASGAAVDAIAIGAGELDAAALAALRTAFTTVGIPLDVVGGDAPLASRLLTFAMGALGIGERGLRRLEVATLARSSYVDPAAFGASRAALLDLARALERTPTASASDARSALGETARASSDDAALGGSRADLALRVADILLPASRKATRAAHASAARSLLVALGLEATASRAAEQLLASDASRSSSAEMNAIARDGRAWAALDASLSDFTRAARELGLDGSMIDPRVFRHELTCALAARRERVAMSAGAVTVGKLDELAGEELDLLVVIEANEGALPSRGEADAVLAESVAPALRGIDPVRAPPSFAVRSARSLTALAVSASRARRIVLTRRARDEEGAAVAPSPVVVWLERGGVRSVPWRASPLDGLATNAREARLRRAALGDAGGVARRARIERARESRFEWAHAPRDPILGDLDLEPSLAPALLDALAAETGGGDRPLAVTSLERFAACPFQGFASQVLHARRMRPLREMPDARESGTLVHRALAAAFRETTAAWRERPRDAARIRTEAMAACDRVLRAESVASSLRKLAVARVREAVAATLEWSLADDSWDFARAEQAFGERRGRDEVWPALVLVDGATRLALGGSIDRVDAGHDRAAIRVIDYKSSRSGAESGMRGLGETSFQVALYAHAAADAFDVSERAGAYVPVARPEAVGPKLKKEFEARWATLDARGASVTPLEAEAIAIVRRVRLGTIAPRPIEERTCAQCDSSGACRKPRFAVARDDDGGAA